MINEWQFHGSGTVVHYSNSVVQEVTEPASYIIPQISVLLTPANHCSLFYGPEEYTLG